MEPNTEPSTCASGSQQLKGYEGVLMSATSNNINTAKLLTADTVIEVGVVEQLAAQKQHGSRDQRKD